MGLVLLGVAFAATAAPVAAMEARSFGSTEPSDTVRLLVGTEEGGAATPQALARVAGGRAGGTIRGLGVRRVDVPQGSAPGAIERLRNSRGVAWVERNHDLRMAHADCTTTPQCVIPNDPLFLGQWYLQNDQRTIQPSLPSTPGADVNAPLAWSLSSGGPTTVAVIDTGIDTGHPDLVGKVDSLYTHSANGGSAVDLTGHGTAVAGLIAARWNNAIGIAGVAPNARLMILKASVGASTSISADAMASAIRVAADGGADIINISSGSQISSSAIREAIVYATSNDAAVVAAAGNDGGTAPTYPADTPFVLSVASTDNRDRRSIFSNYGDWVDLAAPGEEVISTVPTYPTTQFGETTGYAPVSGTSFAAPLVSGAAALVWQSVAATATYPVHAVPLQIIVTADAIEGTGSMWRYGRLNACQALADLAPKCPTPPPPPQAPAPAPAPTPDTTPAPAPRGIAAGTFRRRVAPAATIILNRRNQIDRFVIKPVLRCPQGRTTRRVQLVGRRGADIPRTGRVRLSRVVRRSGRLRRLRVVVTARFTNERVRGQVRASARDARTGRGCRSRRSWSAVRAG